MTGINYPDDGPAIHVPAMDMASWKNYFDKAVACGDLYEDESVPMTICGFAYHKKAAGCGARDWSVKPTFWYPRPGRQFEITCNRCMKMHGVEVRTP